MDTETVLSNDTIDKLKYLLGGFNTFGSNIDVYSICIKKSLNDKMKDCAF